MRYAAKQVRPFATRFCPARTDAGGEVLAHAVRHQELRVLGPAVGALDEADLVVTQRLAMRRGGILPVRRAIADVAVEDDQRRAPFRLRKVRKRVR